MVDICCFNGVFIIIINLYIKIYKVRLQTYKYLYIHVLTMDADNGNV